MSSKIEVGYRVLPPPVGRGRNWRWQVIYDDGSRVTMTSSGHTVDSLFRVLHTWARDRQMQIWRHDERWRIIEHHDYREKKE